MQSYYHNIEFPSISEKPKDDYHENIIQASKIGDFTSVQWLVEKEGVDINQKDEYLKRTSLHWACHEGHLAIAQYLVSKGANVKIKDGSGDYVIHSAAQYGFLPIVKYSIEQQNVHIDTKGHNKKTPLHYACENGHLQIAEYLISKGANIYAKDDRDNTPIHYASESGLLPIVQYLIEKLKVDIDKKGWNSQTPLHYACWNGHLPIVEYLVSKGANIELRSSFQYETPLQTASSRHHTDIVNYLISKGANVNAKRPKFTIKSISNTKNKIEIRQEFFGLTDSDDILD